MLSKAIRFRNTLFLVGLIAGIVGCSAQPANVSTVDQFVGKWNNADLNTQGITRIEIQKSKDGITAEMWGRCHPTECHWGKEIATYNIESNTLSVNWDHSFALRSQILQLNENQQLIVNSRSVYIDGSGRKTQEAEYLYEKGVKHDWSDKE
ncbi:hypothetical protein BIZ37_00175 [Photobacterium sp. BZF1]|uniref:hypothetical protein n=1 Tax=Photobacterium sp. BZF1 TaxID=1904457 RepID=UPI0016538D06|nr:hypothetical protein [Photobacterium sp. BZF1]MBC7000953.1 hypothetical protein [Photobacterium sp. BZF1]